MDLKQLQAEVNARWGSQDTNLCHVSDTNHALVHLTKALGKIASAQNDAEHERRSPRSEEVSKALADLVICAVRYADGITDLDTACMKRLAEKFPVGQAFENRGPDLESDNRRIFNVAYIEVVRPERAIAGEHWIQLRCHHSGDGSPLLVQLPERGWKSSVDEEVIRLNLLVDELTAQRDAFGQKAHHLQERVRDLDHDVG